jgi:hypothetical protein
MAVPAIARHLPISHLLRRHELVPGRDARLRLLRCQPVCLLRSFPAGFLRGLCSCAGRLLSLTTRGCRLETLFLLRTEILLRPVAVPRLRR